MYKRILCFQVSVRLGLVMAIKGFFKKSYPSSIIYDRFDKIGCAVCLYDENGIVLRNGWISYESPFLKYRIPNQYVTDSCLELVASLEAVNLF